MRDEISSSMGVGGACPWGAACVEVGMVRMAGVKGLRVGSRRHVVVWVLVIDGWVRWPWRVRVT